MSSNDERVNLLISAAVDGLRNVESLIGDLRRLEKAASIDLPDNTDELREGLDQTTVTMRALSERLQALRNQQGLVTQFADLKRETRELGEQQASAKKRATELGRALAQTENPTRAQRAEFEKARKEAKATEETWRSNQGELNKLRTALGAAGVSTRDLGSEQGRIRREIAGVDKEIENLSDELRGMKDSASKAGQGVEKATKHTKELGKEAGKTSGMFGRMATSIAAAGAAVVSYFSIRNIVGFFTGAVSEAAAFEEQLDRVQAVSGATAEQMEQLRKAATEMGAQTTFTAVQAGQALETLSRAGLSAEESLAALPEVLALARGNTIELAEAAGLVTKSVSGMGLQFEDSARVADVLTRAAQRANTNVTGLGGALSYAAPTARALGLELEETVGLVGKLADAGIDASRAGTALNSIFSQFSNPASTFRRELDSLGITTNNFLEALEQLEATGERGSKAILAVGQEAGPALRSLLGQGTESLRGLIAELRNSEGAATAAAATMDDNLNGAIARLRSAWSTLKTAFGDRVLERAKTGIDDLANGILKVIDGNAFDRFGEQFQRTFDDLVGSIKRFLTEFDMQAAFARAETAMSAFSTAAQRTGAVLTIMAQSVIAVWQTVNAGVSTAMAFAIKVMAGFHAAANLVVQGLAKIGVVSKETAREFETSAQALNATANAVAQNAVDSGKRTIDAVLKTGEAFVDLASIQEAQVGATQNQQEATEGLTNALSEQNAERENSAQLALYEEIQQQKQAETLRRLKAEYDRLRESGTASLQDIGDALLRWQRAQTDAASAAETVALTTEQAFQRLKLTSQAELVAVAASAKDAFDQIRTDGTSAAQDIERAFLVWARAVVATGDEARIAAVKATGEMLGLSHQMEALGIKTKVAADNVRRLRQELQQGTDDGEQLGDELQQVGPDAESSAQQAAGAFDLFGVVLSKARESVTALGSAVRNLFESRIGSNQFVQNANDAQEALRWAREEVERLRRAVVDVQHNRLADWMNNVALQAARAREQFYQQQVALENLQHKIESGALTLQQLERLAAGAGRQFDLLDAKSLNSLQRAIDAARNKLESLNASAGDTLRNMNQRLLELQGDTEAVQRLQFEAERDRLQRELDKARAAGAQSAAADYAQALSQLQQIYQLEQRKSQEAEQERQREAQERKRAQEAAERERQERNRQQSTTTNQQRSQRSNQTITLQTPSGRSVDVETSDPDALLRVLESAGLRSAS